jgi:AcrR family transcriptional regulator
VETCSAPSTDRATRRRGDALVAAILDATMDELATQGYESLSIERVAEIAQTGKASIYRRWPNKLELTLDAVEANMPSMGTAPDTGELRGDLLIVMRRIAKHVNSRSGTAMRSCMTDLKAHAELSQAIRERLLPPRKQVLLHVLERGVARGEVRPEAVTDRTVELGPKLLSAERVERGRALREPDIVAIVDEVLIPVLSPRSA